MLLCCKENATGSNNGKKFCSILQIFCGVLKYAGRFHCMLISIPEYVFQLFVNILWV